MNVRVSLVRRCTLVCLATIFVAGCVDPKPQAKKREGIFGKKTQEVGEFDPENDAEAADLQVNSLNPLRSYDFAVSQITQAQVDRLVVMFEIENNHFPRDHEEFMRVIIERRNVQLPVLSSKRRYQYNVETHKLMVVEAKKK